MFIKSLSEADAIVENNDSLSWNGWVILETIPNKDGYIDKDGVFLNGKWVVQKRYEPGTKGWEIPKRLVMTDGTQG